MMIVTATVFVNEIDVAMMNDLLTGDYDGDEHNNFYG